MIRSGNPSDIPNVLELWRAAGSVQSATDSEAGLGMLLERDPEALLVAEQNSSIVGSLIAGWDGWRGNFYRLAVHPDHRRRGLATELVRAGEQRLAERGGVRLAAIVASDEAHATSFWGAIGYERQEARGRFVRVLASSFA